MKLATRILIAIWVLFATLALARFWLKYYYLFPLIPESFAIWLTDLYGATNAEEVADVEILLALSGAFVIVALVTAAALWAWRKTRQSARLTLE